MKTAKVLVFVENISAKRFADAVLRAYPVKIVDAMTLSSAIAQAEQSLEAHPEQPVAVLLNLGKADPALLEQWRASTTRLLARNAPQGWCVAYAVPRLDAWAMSDPRIKETFEADEATRTSYWERSLHIGAIVKKKPFDATNLLRENEDFRGLVEFIERHAAVPAATKKSAV